MQWHNGWLGHALMLNSRKITATSIRRRDRADQYAVKHGLNLNRGLTFKDLGVSGFGLAMEPDESGGKGILPLMPVLSFGQRAPPLSAEQTADRLRLGGGTARRDRPA